MEFPNPVGREYFFARFPMAFSFILLGAIGFVFGASADAGIFESGMGSTEAAILIIMGAFVLVAGVLRLWECTRVSRSMPRNIEMGSDHLTAMFRARTPEGVKIVSRTLPFTAIDDVKPGMWDKARLPGDSGTPPAAYGRFEPSMDGVSVKLLKAQRDARIKAAERVDFIYLTLENYERVHSLWAQWKSVQPAPGAGKTAARPQ